MRSELEVPFQFSGVRIERNDAIGVEIVARAYGAIEIRRRIAGAPVQRVQIRIVGPGHPSRAATALIGFPWPAFRAGSARPRKRPESPLFLSSPGGVSGQEAAHTVIATRCADKHFVVNDQGRTGRSVVLVS